MPVDFFPEKTVPGDNIELFIDKSEFLVVYPEKLVGIEQLQGGFTGPGYLPFAVKDQDTVTTVEDTKIEYSDELERIGDVGVQPHSQLKGDEMVLLVLNY